MRTLLRGGTVLTLGDRTSNLVTGDVLIDGDIIAEVGPGLRARDAEHLDATDCIILPGFIDTHRHSWRTLLRHAGDDTTGQDHRHAASAPAHRDELTPDDVYAGTLLGLLSALESGITTVVDIADLDAPGTEAALRAHEDAGVRTVLVHGDLTTIERLGGSSDTSDSRRTRFAFGSPEPTDRTLDHVAAEWTDARARGLRIHAHVGSTPAHRGITVRLAERGLLGGDVTLVHCSHLDEPDLAAIAGSGAAVSITPAREMAAGLGLPPLQALLDAGIRPGLGTDDERVGPGDAFGQMRATQSLQHAAMFDRRLAGKGSLPHLLTTREVLRFATADGARVAGLDTVTGSLEPGMQADIVVLRTDRPNIAPVNDPIGAIVWGMDPSNVDWVFVAGQPRVRNGVIDADVAHVRQLAVAARDRLVRAGGPLAAANAGDGR
ncbi:MAG: amidohydrolase family protein [Nitriliruptoraceae bacterium]